MGVFGVKNVTLENVKLVYFYVFLFTLVIIIECEGNVTKLVKVEVRYFV